MDWNAHVHNKCCELLKVNLFSQAYLLVMRSAILFNDAVSTYKHVVMKKRMAMSCNNGGKCGNYATNV
jgi:hypothetical protein